MIFDSNEHWKKCLNLIPKGTQTSSKSFLHLGGIPPTFIDRGNGAYFYTKNNERYLDYGGSLGPNILGYGNKMVNSAIRKQLKKGILFSLPTEEEYILSELITKVIPNAEQVQFAKNGSDGVLGAIRLASAYHKKHHIARYGYNGFSDRAIASFMPAGLPPELKDQIHDFKYNDLNDLERILQQYECSCILMEAVSTEEPREGFLQGVRKLADKYDVALIFDEVITGFRYDFNGCQGRYKVDADLIALGKAIAGNMPLSVLCGKRKYMSLLYDEVFYSMTFGGEVLSIVSAIATIEQLKEKDYSYLWNISDKLASGILDKASKHGLKIDFYGVGPRRHITFSNDQYGIEKANMAKYVFHQEMFKQNIYFPTNVAYINFAMKHKDIDNTIKASDKAFSFVSKNLANIHDCLECEKPFDIFLKKT